MDIPRLAITVAGQTHETSGHETVTIGSDVSATIRLTREGISRRHVAIAWESDRWVLTDPGSTNGTYRDRNKVARIEIDEPLTVRLGHPDDGVELHLRPTPVVAPPPSLLIVTPHGRRELLPPGPVIVGRDSTADITLTSELVSRRHLELSWSNDDGWVATDLESSNGTYLKGERVTRLVIDGAATVMLGDAHAGVPIGLGGDPVLPSPPEAAPPTPPARPPSAPPPAGPGLPAAAARRPRAQISRPGPSPRSIGIVREASQIYRPASGKVRIGRAPDNDIVVDDLVASRYHAELQGDPVTGYELRDLGSFNGTFVNGTQVERVRIAEGDFVGIGHHRFRFAAGELEEHIDAGDILFQAENLSVRTAGGLDILQGVTFALPERSLMAVVGPSGAGKSTLLNALTGFRPAQQGTVLYHGRDLYAYYDDLRQRIGYVPQDDILHVDLTVQAALDYAATLRFPPDVDAQQRSARVAEVLDELGLSHRASVPIRQLSGGQRKRASVAIELLTKPSLLFLDEPTSGLDPGYERSLTRMLRELADGGRTVVVVTHSVQSLDLCDRMIFLAPGGRTAFFGPPDEAVAYFKEDTYAEVFETLEHDQSQDWRGRFESHPAFRRYVLEPIGQSGPEAESEASRQAAKPMRRRGSFRQFLTLTRRYLSVIASDRRVVLLMALQGPILGLLMLAALPPNQLTTSEGGAVLSQAAAVLAVLIVGVTGLGLSNSIREVVKESAIYQRERAVGLSIPAYVASKAVVLAAITTVQSAALVLIGIQRQGEGWGPAFIEPPEFEIMLSFAAAGVAAAGIGLMISAFSKSADRAVTLLPVILIIQLVLSGAFQGVLQKPVLREASYFATAQWGFAAGASTVDLNSLQALNACLEGLDTSSSRTRTVVIPETGPVELPAELAELAQCAAAARGRDSLINDLGLTPAEADAIFSTREARQAENEPPLRFWDQTPADWLTNVAVLGVFIVASLMGAGWALRRKDPQLLRT